MTKDKDGKFEFGGEQAEIRDGVKGHFDNVEESSWDENADVTNNLNVYPNPSTGTFKFVADAGALSVSVTDLSGKTVYNYENKNHNELVHTIELENVYTGMYIAKIVNNGVMSVVKLQVAK
jgi:hypothetical protein